MMPKLVRAAGRRLRNYVLPLVGYWDLVARLDELRARLGRIEVRPAERSGDQLASRPYLPRGLRRPRNG